MVIIVLVVVICYGFQSGYIILGGLCISFIVLQESVMYLYVMLFMLVSVYILKYDVYVWVDVFYCRFLFWVKVLVDLLGILLLLFLVCGFIFYISFDFVDFVWNMKECFGEFEGFVYVYLLKILIFVMVVLLFL